MCSSALKRETCAEQALPMPSARGQIASAIATIRLSRSFVSCDTRQKIGRRCGRVAVGRQLEKIDLQLKSHTNSVTGDSAPRLHSAQGTLQLRTVSASAIELGASAQFADMKAEVARAALHVSPAARSSLFPRNPGLASQICNRLDIMVLIRGNAMPRLPHLTTFPCLPLIALYSNS